MCSSDLDYVYIGKKHEKHEQKPDSGTCYNGAIYSPCVCLHMADQYRRQQVQVSELFRARGEHAFDNGWNMRAAWAFIIASIPSILVAVVQVDFCRFLSPFSWFIGAGLGLIAHLAISRNDPQHRLKIAKSASGFIRRRRIH